jgi:drug/metabolite transporter (DMT)-like permease
MGLHWLCLFGAVNIANVSIALAGLATLSVFTAFTEPLFYRVKVRRFEVLLGLLVLFGICLIAGAEVGHLPGLVLALLSALFAAVFMVLNKRIVEDGNDPMVMVGWEMLAATVVCFGVVPFIDPGAYGALLVGEIVEWFWILLLAWGCTVFAQALANKLLKSISAYAFNLAANFEPVYGMIAAALIFAEYENLGVTFYLGACAIVVANLLHPGLERRFGIRPSPGGLV